jgi:hypothetical protein
VESTFVTRTPSSSTLAITGAASGASTIAASFVSSQMAM